MEVRRIILPSRIRRGRLSTTPVWHAEHEGVWMLFHRKRDAVRYAEAGCETHAESNVFACKACNGRKLREYELGASA